MELVIPYFYNLAFELANCSMSGILPRQKIADSAIKCGEDIAKWNSCD